MAVDVFASTKRPERRDCLPAQEQSGGMMASMLRKPTRMMWCVQAPFRLLAFTVMDDVHVVALCGAEPPLDTVVTEVRQ
jgi:hypothetical protein